jgi:hypothetical protein
MADEPHFGAGQFNFPARDAGLGFNKHLVIFNPPLIFRLLSVQKCPLAFLIVFRRVFAMLFGAYPTFSVFYRIFPIKNSPSRFIYFGDCTNP